MTMFLNTRMRLEYLLRRPFSQNRLFRNIYHLALRLRILSPHKASSSDPLVVYRIDFAGIFYLQPVSRDCILEVKKLPQTIVMDPGEYLFGGAFFNCCQPGLYRFSVPGIINQQAVVLDRSDPISSSLFLSLLSVRGNRDSGRSNSHLRRSATERLISLTCGSNVKFVHQIMKHHGFNTRVVHSHSLQAPNSYNNGHTLLEVYESDADRFVVIDIDKKMYFSYQGEPLSLVELCSIIKEQKEIALHKMCKLSAVDWCGFKEPFSGFDYGFIEQGFYFNDENILSCLSRICQVPLILSEDEWWVCAWDDIDVQRLSEIDARWILLSPTEFFRKFY